jgi:hypothetical protein
VDRQCRAASTAAKYSHCISYLIFSSSILVWTWTLLPVRAQQFYRYFNRWSKRLILLFFVQEGRFYVTGLEGEGYYFCATVCTYFKLLFYCMLLPKHFQIFSLYFVAFKVAFKTVAAYYAVCIFWPCLPWWLEDWLIDRPIYRSICLMDFFFRHISEEDAQINITWQPNWKFKFERAVACISADISELLVSAFVYLIWFFLLNYSACIKTLFLCLCILIGNEPVLKISFYPFPT